MDSVISIIAILIAATSMGYSIHLTVKLSEKSEELQHYKTHNTELSTSLREKEALEYRLEKAVFNIYEKLRNEKMTLKMNEQKTNS